MPTNVTPEFRKAQAAFRRSRDPAERLDLAKEMLRLIPKHKGTEHLQADIKSRIKELTEALSGPKKTGAKSGPPVTFRPEGAAQVVLLGPPNSGKSALHARLTGSHSASEAYPFTTQYPQPGMFLHEDAPFQLIDVPSISSDHPIGWIGNTVQPADAALLVVDLGEPGCVEQCQEVLGFLEEKKVFLIPDWPGRAEIIDEEDESDPFATVLPTLLVANKADRIDDPEGELEVFEELGGLTYPAMAVSATSGAGLDALGPWLMENLGVVRVYTKLPGESADGSAPFTIRAGQTVMDVAIQIHKDVAADLKYARVWGRNSFQGQQVGRDYQPADGDVLELHS